jgi:hypothetical protein
VRLPVGKSPRDSFMSMRDSVVWMLYVRGACVRGKQLQHRYANGTIQWG